MILWSGSIDAIDVAGISLDDCWVWTSADTYGLDYQEVLQQPINLDAVGGLQGLRFLPAITSVLVTIRRGNQPTDQLAWLGTVLTEPDPETDPSTPSGGTVTSVGIVPPALMDVVGSPVETAGDMTLHWNGSPLDLVLADGTTFALADIVTPPHNSLTGRGVADAHPMSAITGLVSTFGHYLPLAAGPSSPLAGTLHGTSLYFSGWTADAPIVVAMNYSSAFAHAITVVNFGLTAGQRLTVDFGQSAYTNNQANFGFVYAGAGSTANKITLGLYGNNDLVTIAGTGVVTVRDLGTGFVRATSGVLSASALAGADLPNSGVTAATYGSATQSAVVVVDAKGRITSASNITITPAFASITGKPTTLAGYGITDATLQNAYNASTVGATTPQILTSAAKGALYIRRGSAADTDNVFVIENGTGADQFLVTGNGDVTARRLVLTKDSSTYTDSAALELASNTPRIRMFNTAAGGANQQGWEITCAGTYLSWDSLTDAGDVAGAMLAATKAPDGRLASVAIGGGGYLNGGLIINNSTGIATVLGGYSTQFGTSSQFLKADGSVDSTAYAPAFASGAAGLVWATPAATAGVPSLRALAASDIPTLNQNTTGSAAKWATARTLTIGSTGKAVDGSANVSWSLGEIGAQAAGTYLTPSNITGSVGQIPALTGVATIAGDPGLTRTQVSSVTNAVAIGDGSVAGAVGLVLNGAAGQYKYIGLRSGGLTSWEIASEAATHLFAISAYNLGTPIDEPLKIVSVAGGAISIGGGGRPVNLTSGSKIQINGADAITSARAGDLTALKVGSATGFVRSAGGTYSASALVAADIPNLDASKITTGTLPDVRISSASTWNAKVGGSGTTGYLPTWTGAGTLGNSAILEVSSYLSSSKPMAIENLYLAKLTSSSIHWGAIYGAASTPSGTNYLFTGKDDGTESELNGATSSALSVGGTKVVTAQSSGATLAGTTTLSALAGATTRIATISAAGQIGATSWAYDGPWLSLANGGTVTGSTTFSGLYTSITTQLLLSSGAKIRTGLLDIYDNKIEASGLAHFMGSPGFQFDDGVPLAIKSAATVGGTGGSLSFDSDAKFYPKRIHITTTTYTLPVVAVGETILLTFDVSACQLSTNSSQSVTWRASNGTNSFAAASTTNFDAFGYGTGTRIASAWMTGVSSTRVDIRG